MKEYIVKLSDAEDKALHAVAISAQEWIDNLVHERCRIAIEEIVAEEIQRRLANGETISGTKEDIVLSADIETAEQKNIRLLAEFEASQKSQG